MYLNKIIYIKKNLWKYFLFVLIKTQIKKVQFRVPKALVYGVSSMKT